MKRKLYNELLEWKKSRRRKPLLIQGARQVGKTYLVDQFGKNEYKNYIYVNFERELKLSSIFKSTLNPSEIIENISLYKGIKIESKDTLIFFDEIQAVPEAITSLKYFYEEAKEYHLIAAGSLLGVTVGKGISFPVGKVNFKTLYPLSFIEYLEAFGEEQLVKKIEGNIVTFPDIIHEKLNKHLKIYLYLGGMPEVVNDYLLYKDISTVREIQKEILYSYEKDFSKYADKQQAIKNSEIWNSVSWQLAKENKKFKYSDLKKGGRSSMFDTSIEWLKNAGLIIPAYNIKVPKYPLSGYIDYNKFKIYTIDTGLMGAKLDISSELIIFKNQLFSEYNGAFTENFVASELVKLDFDLFYWRSKSDAEVDFIVSINNNIYPLEVKSGLSKNKKSLISYLNRYNPDLILRTSPRNFKHDDNFINIPLYYLFKLKDIIAHNGKD